MSVPLPAHHTQASQGHSHAYQGRDENAHLVASYTHDADLPTHKRTSSPSSYVDRNSLAAGRQHAQVYGAAVPVQLPSLNGVFHDPTRTLYGPGMGTGTGLSGAYGGPTHTDENTADAFRMPLVSSTPSPHSLHDYQHQPEQPHQDTHNSYSHASYHDQHARRDYHSGGATSTIASSSNSGSYTHPRQHHPHTQMLPSMLYATVHPDDTPSSSAFARPFGATASHTYAHSHSSSSLSPHSGSTQNLPSTSVTSNDDRQNPAPPQPSARAHAKRREKPKIELAPDQPLTTQGKPRARVYVACVQW